MLWRAQVTLKHSSGLPRDNASNTFWITTAAAGLTQAVAEPLAEAVRDFYTIDPGVDQAAAIMQYLSTSLAANGHEVKMSPIDVATGLDARGEGFPPVWTETFDFVGWAPNATPLPSEAAVCVSFKNTTDGAVPPARRRGRAYIGPCGQNAGEKVGQTLRPSQAFREDLVAAAKHMAAQLVIANAQHVVFSRPFAGRDQIDRPGNPRGPLPALPPHAGATHVVDSWWVDNAFDTMRKRGERSTLRTIG